MPRIAAPTVKEHRELIRTRLIDAAEAILKENPGETLTATDVAARAGVARNSIYRYVDSVSDLHALVIARKVGP